MADGSKLKENRPKKYICTFKGCNKKYTRPCLLEQHIRSHTNERRFKCSVDGCGKTFLRPCHLKVHSWTHSDVKPRTCDHCGRGFTTSQQLSRHLATHGEKPDSSSSPSVELVDSETSEITKFDSPNFLGGVQDNNVVGGEIFGKSEASIPSSVSATVTRRICPYGCGRSFVTETELGDHMLEKHLMSEILHNEQLNMHPSGQFSPLSDLDLPINDENVPVAWQDHKCKEEQCQGYDAFPDTTSLIQHYDTFHSFVPFSLISPVFEHSGEGSATSEPCTVDSQTSNSSPSEFPSTIRHENLEISKEPPNGIIDRLGSSSVSPYAGSAYNGFMDNQDLLAIDEFLASDLDNSLSVL